MASKRHQLTQITEQFIELWEIEKSLWDSSSPLYKSKRAKQLSFLRFKEELDFEEHEVRTKINTLRSYFIAEMKKIQRDPNYELKWVHYDSLLFLKDTINSRKKSKEDYDEMIGETTCDEQYLTRDGDDKSYNISTTNEAELPMVTMCTDDDLLNVRIKPEISESQRVGADEIIIDDGISTNIPGPSLNTFATLPTNDNMNSISDNPVHSVDPTIPSREQNRPSFSTLVTVVSTCNPSAPIYSIPSTLSSTPRPLTSVTQESRTHHTFNIVTVESLRKPSSHPPKTVNTSITKRPLVVVNKASKSSSSAIKRSYSKTFKRSVQHKPSSKRYSVGANRNVGSGYKRVIVAPDTRNHTPIISKSSSNPISQNNSIVSRSTSSTTVQNNSIVSSVSTPSAISTSSVASASMPTDGDELFGLSIAQSLKSIADTKTKEYIKYKMQELIYKTHVGLIDGMGHGH